MNDVTKENTEIVFPPVKKAGDNTVQGDTEIIFINDGQGHCGVYENPPGICRPIECDPPITVGGGT